jgi:hypothetical protein
MAAASPGSDRHDESIVYAATTHWMKYMPKLLLSLLLGASGILLLAVAWFVKGIPAISLLLFFAGFLFILIAHHRLFHALLSEEMLDIIVTNKRILFFDDCLFFCDDEHEVPLHKVAAVEARQRGILQNILNYGTIWFDTGGGVMDLKRTIPYVHQPDHVAGLIADILDASRS